MQNTSHAVMAQRTEAKDSLDDFPTPPWATRALIEHVIEPENGTANLSALEPACGRGYMAQALKEYFGTVHASDTHDYGYSEVSDFLSGVQATGAYDWVITNPPFRLAEEFIQRSLPIARRGVAMLVRTVFIESVGRYNRLFSITPPTKVAQFTERVPMVKGRVDRKASTATGYAWVVWEKNLNTTPALVWVPPCRKKLEKDADYDATFLTGESASEAPCQKELFG
ncbi:SAM-dependent methyltransferase [Ruegeria sp. HKCCD6228]|uniref:SAM-dependent methyltransferase n=1 Tax=Ruegeria sp. HKCCD6228 TaxID=2683001 RepID=UPI0014912F40|nr:SAM-dependent methyltransferase [Ruegeria sp. HKCCD6228]NOD99579.1 SAM-dependent methyltransferase [Ruegeria sp. HKCCD6228]